MIDSSVYVVEPPPPVRNPGRTPNQIQAPRVGAVISTDLYVSVPIL